MTPLAVSKEHLAGVVSRGIAYLIDCGCAFVIFAITQFLVFLPIRSAVGITDEWFRSGLNTELYTILTISIPVWLYFSVLESSPWRATIGKRILGIQVVDVTSQLGIRFPRSLLRIVIKLIPWELAHIGNNLPEPIWYSEKPGFRVCFLLSGLVMTCYVVVPFIDARRRSIHDMVSRTLVISASPRGDNNPLHRSRGPRGS